MCGESYCFARAQVCSQPALTSSLSLSLSLSTHTHTHTHTHYSYECMLAIHTHKHTHAHTHTHVHTHTHTHTQIYGRMRKKEAVSASPKLPPLRILIESSLFIHAHARMHAQSCMYHTTQPSTLSIYTHTYMHAHTHEITHLACVWHELLKWRGRKAGVFVVDQSSLLKAFFPHVLYVCIHICVHVCLCVHTSGHDSTRPIAFIYIRVCVCMCPSRT